MNTKLIYFAAAVAAGFFLANTLSGTRPFSDAYAQGQKLKGGA